MRLSMILLLSSAAWAASPRVAVIAQVNVDGATDDPKALEAMVTQALATKGARMVDAAQVDARRAELLSPDAGTSSIDADWLYTVSAICKGLETQKVLPSAPALMSAQCDLTFTLTQTDTGERASSLSLAANGAAATVRQAARKAFERVIARFNAEQVAGVMTSISTQRQPRRKARTYISMLESLLS